MIAGMQVQRKTTATTLAALILAIASGCGGSSSTPSSQATGSPSVGTSAPASSGSGGSQPSSSGAGALVAEAQSAAAGDIPDNQVFLLYHNGSGGYSIRYPEGWARRGSAKTVLFRDKNNLVRIVVEPGAASAQAARAAVLGLAGKTPSLKLVSVTRHPTCSNQGTTEQLPLVSARVVYTTKSPPNPVTGKSVTLQVDRYYLGHGANRAVVDLGTPQGVDNVDAYCQMIKSFAWR
ncbi:MAG: hypothetical protein ACHQEA_06355 [Gaiellales bacterium]